MISSKIFNRGNATLLSLLAASALFTACGDEATGPSGNPWPSDKLIHLISPVGGETVHVGDVVHVKWETKSDQVNAVDVVLSPDNGKTWSFYLDQARGGAIRPTDAEWGDFQWTVPESVSGGSKTVSLAGNTQVLLRVEQYTPGNDSLIMEMPKTMTILAKP